MAQKLGGPYRWQVPWNCFILLPTNNKRYFNYLFKHGCQVLFIVEWPEFLCSTSSFYSWHFFFFIIYIFSSFNHQVFVEHWLHTDKHCPRKIEKVYGNDALLADHSRNMYTHICIPLHTTHIRWLIFLWPHSESRLLYMKWRPSGIYKAKKEWIEKEKDP